jgi:hypothetical protein
MRTLTLISISLLTAASPLNAQRLNEPSPLGPGTEGVRPHLATPARPRCLQTTAPWKPGDKVPFRKLTPVPQAQSYPAAFRIPSADCPQPQVYEASPAE